MIHRGGIIFISQLTRMIAAAVVAVAERTIAGRRQRTAWHEQRTVLSIAGQHVAMDNIPL